MLRSLIEIFKDLWKISPSSVFALSVFALYGSGFIIWNQRLIPFGFFEYNLLQVRFIAAGLLYILILLIVIVLIDCVLFSFGVFEISKSSIVLIVFLLSIIVLIFFQTLFIYLPQWIGGGRPIPTTILGTEEQIEYLGSLGIKMADNGGKKSIQTGLICLIYQNDRYIVFQSINESSLRNVPLSRDRFIGFSSVSPDLSEKGCSTF